MSVSIEHEVFLVPSQLPTIQAAIDAVIRPSTIMVSPGVFVEDLEIAGRESVVIQSARFGRRGVTITGRSAASVIRVDHARLYLSGIEIRSDGRARGIAAVDASVSLQECVIVGNHAGENDDEQAGAGMLCLRSSVRVQKSTIATNVVHGGAKPARGGGLALVDCKVEIAGSSIQTNAVYSSATAGGGGIWSERCSMRMWRSRVTDNALYAAEGDGAGIYFREAIDAQLGGSVITGNGSTHGRGGGIFIGGAPDRVSVHSNSAVRQNHPEDLFVE